MNGSISPFGGGWGEDVMMTEETHLRHFLSQSIKYHPCFEIIRKILKAVLNTCGNKN